MYNTFGNQLYHLLHYGFSFLLIGLIAPFFIFSRTFESTGEQLISNYIRSVFVVIVLGYVLVITNLFEVISLVLIFLVALIFTHLSTWKKVMGEHSFFALLFRFFDMLDGLVIVDKDEYKDSLQKKVRNFASIAKTFVRRTDPFIKTIFIVIVLGYAFYIRFYDAVAHAALPMSDSYVTLAWMKYINQRILFHDGIYPQGFHIYLATMLKFAAIDGVYVLKYTGPLNTFLIVCGFYYITKRLTGSYFAGITAAVVYGLLGHFLLYGDLERQSATNSQEFGFLFIFPTLYFFIVYLLKKDKHALLTGFLGLSVIGLVHTLAFAYVGLAVCALLAAFLILKHTEGIRQIVRCVVYCSLSVILSLLPLGIGYLLGKEMHSSSEQYLTSTAKGTIAFAPLHFIDYLTLASLVLPLFVVLKKGMPFKEKWIALFALILGIGFFLLYFAGGHYTDSILISSRSLDLWALTVPFCLGVSANHFEKGLLRFAGKVNEWRVFYQWGLSFLMIAFVIYVFHPGPITPYKMERDVSVEQYLKIRNYYTNDEWMIVSEQEGYAKVLGSGVHMYLSDFVKRYDPTKKPLTLAKNGQIDRNVPPDVFVFHAKKIYEVPKTLGIYSILKPIYDKKSADNAQFAKWLKTYKAHGYAVDVYYKDDQFVIYHFHIKKPKETEQKKLLHVNNG